MAKDPYADAPIDTPYEDLARGGASRQRSLIENSYREAEREEEERKRIAAKNAAALLVEERRNIAEGNKIIEDQAKDFGTDAYLYSDEKGIKRTSLTEDQIRQSRNDREEDEAEASARENAKWEAEDLGRQIKDIAVYTPADRAKKEKRIGELQTALEKEKSVDNPNSGFVTQSEKEVGILTKDLEGDDTNTAKKKELQTKAWDRADFHAGRPEGMPRVVSDDPKERVDFLKSYNSRTERLNGENKRIEENARAETERYLGRSSDLKSQYDEWLTQGVTPEQAAEGRRVYSKSMGEARAGYLRGRFQFDQQIKGMRDEREALDILRPFVDKTMAAHNVWGVENEEQRKKDVQTIADTTRGKATDLAGMSPEAAKIYGEMADSIENGTATPESLIAADARAGKMLQAYQEKHNENLQGALAALTKQAGGDNFLKAFAKGEVTMKNGEIHVPRFAVAEGPEGGLLDKIDPTTVKTGAKTLAKFGNLFAEHVMGDHDMRSSHLENFQKEAGLSDEQMKAVFRDIKKMSAEWGDPSDEKSRTMEDGSIKHNPELNIADDEIYKDMDQSSDAPQYVKDYMMVPEIAEQVRMGYAGEIHERYALNAMMNPFMKSPDEFAMEYRAGLAPGDMGMSYPDLMAAYKKQEIDGRSWAADVAGFGVRNALAFFASGDKMAQMTVGVGAIVNIPGAIDMAQDLAEKQEELRTAREYSPGKVPYLSYVTELVLEESLPLAAMYVTGGGTAIAGKAVLGRAVAKGLLTAKTMSSIAGKLAINSSVAAGGVQSMGLSWQGYYDDALKAEEARVGHELSDDEKQALANTPAVAGKAMAAGLITAVMMKATGATGDLALFRSSTFTVRDFIKSFGNGATKKQVLKRLYGASRELLKDYSGEFLEEAGDEFLNSLLLDENATFGDALAGSWESGKGGGALGFIMGLGAGMSKTGNSPSNFSNSKTALDALKDVYGKEIKDFTQGDVDEGLALAGLDPSRGSKNPEIAARNLRTAIETSRAIKSDERAAEEELDTATRLGDKQRMANAKLDLTSIRQASAVIKLAGGAQVTDLTVSEQRAINENLPDGTPSYVVENGEIIVTSNGMSAAARRYNDAVGQLVGQSETDRRKGRRPVPVRLGHSQKVRPRWSSFP